MIITSRQIRCLDTPGLQSRSPATLVEMNGSDQTRALVLGTAVLLLAVLAASFPVGELRPDWPPSSPIQDLPRVETDRLVRDLSILSHDSMEGRASGSPGIARARAFLTSAFEDRGFSEVAGERTQEFQSGSAGQASGVNVLGLVEGREFPGRYLVVSAHYDHLGMRGDEIYNGADDNASGSAALLAIGAFFAENRPRHSVLLVAFDGEELGLLGAQAFVSDPPVPLDAIVMNVNLDMVSRSERKELYAVGTYHYPFLAPLIGEVAGRADLSLLTGHDEPGLPAGDDWTSSSDHGRFHEAGIPFIYFGVEDHAGYHHPTDTFDNVTLDFYVDAVETIVEFIRVVDREGELN